MFCLQRKKGNDGTVIDRVDRNVQRLLHMLEGIKRLNPAFFRQVRVDCGTLCWPNDIDIDPEEVWDDCVKETKAAIGRS